jgi:phospholipase C
LVVIYAENHSFDNLYGLFPGAEGIAQADISHSLHIDHDSAHRQQLTQDAAQLNLT